ncbi:hypothetical protein G6F47_011822 [Rhizopus delemar]|nr:hypothetical protein G6F48_011761 [Rhizopus delemar]KAG1584106.1 hypothetical protein G6F47_011822 [Rhizopus delemar]
MLKKYAESGYKENKWKEKADRCDLRIQTYERILREEETSEQQLVHQESDESEDMLDFTNLSEELPANEERALKLEDTEIGITNDLPRRRIKVLIAIIKAVLYEHPQELILSSHFQEKASEIDEREMRVCLQIVNIVSSYFPLPNHRKLFQYTIPFILMANKIFHVIGLSRRMISICPLTNPGRLISLHADAPSLFSLLCGTTAKDKPMNVYDFDGQIMATRMIATEQKDAMFASFFDLKKVYTMCNSWKHTFGYYIVVLPGANTIRITNKLNNYPTQQSCKKLPVKEKINQEDPSPSHQQFGTRPSPEFFLSNSQQQESLLNLTQEIEAQLKAKWSSPNKTYISKAARVAQNKARGNTEIFDQIKIAKTRKRALYKAVQEAKSQLRMLRHRMYLMKKKDKINSTKSPNNLITEESYKCFENVDDLTVDTYLLEKPNKVAFSGTDNGLVTLSETVGFDMRKLRFHLDLYKWYRAPGTENSYDTSTLDKDLLSVPTSFKIKSKDLLYLSGGYTSRNNLLRAKRSSLSGASATKSEALLLSYSIQHSSNLMEAKTAFNVHQQEKNVLRKFYYSSTRMKRKRRYEIQKRKAYDCVCSAERRRCHPCPSQKSSTRFIMFVGERGYGYGSRGAIALKTVNGTSVCNNNECILSLSGTSHKARDSVSALAIGISGASRLISGTTLEVFNPSATTTIR